MQGGAGVAPAAAGDPGRIYDGCVDEERVEPGRLELGDRGEDRGGLALRRVLAVG